MRINTRRLRLTIGWLGLLLPWIVIPLIHYIPQSVSATWYTNACTVFMIILGSASLLLICYKGYNKLDDIILSLSGITGLGICLFPCYIAESGEYVGTFMIDRDISNVIHSVCALLFFGLLSYNSMFLFTKDNGIPTKQKKKRNIIYYICSIGMLGSFTILLLPAFPCRVWLMEALALFFFGVSFLTKADAFPFLFCDKK